MFKTLFKPNSYLQNSLRNQIKHNKNNLNRFFNSHSHSHSHSQINKQTRENIENYILTTQICSMVGATGGIIIYGGDALLKNAEKDFLVHFIETMKGTTIGFMYGAWIGFFWPITASVLMIRFCNASLKAQHKFI
jgi:hypothetical protein